jgi:predicted  nucleic acid-binding Zn-ribbon protein
VNSAVIDGNLLAELGHDTGDARVKPDVAALLEVQADDLKTYGIEDRLSALAPRLAALEKERLRAVEAGTAAHKQVEADEVRLRDVQDRLRQHRELLEKSEKLLGQVSVPREAAAAMAQIEQAKRFIADEEREVTNINQHLSDLRKDVTAKEAAVKDIEKLQQETRATLDADRTALETELKGVLKEREKKASAVPKVLMQKYDHIRKRRRSEAVFALRGNSCAHCDVDIPVQRRSTMKSTGATEVCEGCGVLLFAGD